MPLQVLAYLAVMSICCQHSHAYTLNYCRGIPTDTHPSTGKSSLETVLTVLHAGGKFGGGSETNGANSGYTVSGGLHGVGISVVNALSEMLEVEVLRNGLLYKQAFSKGEPVSELTQQPAPVGAYDTGTKVRGGCQSCSSESLYFDV